MANSKYEYVRAFERDDILLPNCWIVVRIDGRGFHKLSDHYRFTKPNDLRALELMNAAAQRVIAALPDLCFGYGVSDEYSFVFEKHTSLFERRAMKLVSTVVSTFTAFYVALWRNFMGGELDVKGGWLPTFDGRAVVYPSAGNLRDYLAWRQVDCHINNLYNTTFWAMVQKGGMTNTAAEAELKGTVAADKNEILWSRFGINYNNEAEICRKGSVILRELEGSEVDTAAKDQAEKMAGVPRATGDVPENMTAVPEKISRTHMEKRKKEKRKAAVVVVHADIVKDEFWEKKPWILGGRG